MCWNESKKHIVKFFNGANMSNSQENIDVYWQYMPVKDLELVTTLIPSID